MKPITVEEAVPGTPVWYYPHMYGSVRYAGVIQSGPSRLGSETVVRLHEMEEAYSKQHASGRTTVPAAQILCVEPRAINVSEVASLRAERDSLKSQVQEMGKAMRESAERYHRIKAHDPMSSHDPHGFGDWDTCNSLPCRHAQFALSPVESASKPPADWHDLTILVATWPEDQRRITRRIYDRGFADGKLESAPESPGMDHPWTPDCPCHMAASPLATESKTPEPKRELSDPRYQIGPGMVNFTAWSRENIPKGPPAFNVGDRVVITDPLYVLVVGQDCDGTPLFTLSREQPSDLTEAEWKRLPDWTFRAQALSADSLALAPSPDTCVAQEPLIITEDWLRDHDDMYLHTVTVPTASVLALLRGNRMLLDKLKDARWKTEER